MISAAAPRLPTQARAARIASTNTKPNPSSRLGITNAVQRSYSRCERLLVEPAEKRSRDRRAPARPPFARAAHDRRRRRRCAARRPGTAAATSRQISSSGSCPLYRSSSAIRPTMSADGGPPACAIRGWQRLDA